MKTGRLPVDERCVHRVLRKDCVTCLREAVHDQWQRAETHKATIASMMLKSDVYWAEMLLSRDEVEGRRVLKRMIAYYVENDSRADDFGRLRIVIDAQRALGEEQ